MRNTIIQVVALALLQVSASGGCRKTPWVDFDSPEPACTITLEGEDYVLVFSDEFTLPGRTFADGLDARWTAIETHPFSNGQINYYNASLATTRKGYLDITATSDHTHFKNNTLETRVFQTAMLQSWNKFCFSQGVLEYSAQLPGNGSVFGLWPAFWMMGNLGRAVLNPSSAGMWPFNFDECVENGSADCDASQCDAMRTTACEQKPSYGLKPGQGRGAPEIDVVEIQPGDTVLKYQCTSAPYNATFANELALRHPLLYTTLQMGPGIPHDSDQAPVPGCIGSGYPMELFPFHYEGARPSNSKHDVLPGWSEWSTYFSGAWPEEPQTPAPFTREILAATMTLDDDAFSSQKVYRLMWNVGEGAVMRWYYDGDLIYELAEEMLKQPRNITKQKQPIGTLEPRMFPHEPMYLLLNVDIAPTWGGWPSKTPTSKEYSHPGCPQDCYDCSRRACKQCYVNGTNVWQWFADFCETLPTSYLIDYVRVYQPPGAVNVGCDPSDYPTANFIGNQAERYTFEGSESPLLGVPPGGGPCSQDDDCGGLDQLGTQRGHCTDGICLCTYHWTGPTCRSQSAGAALECRKVEIQALETWLSFTHDRAQLSDCTPNREYNVTVLLMMVDLACTDKYGPRPFKTKLVDPICSQINASYTGDDIRMWQCTAFSQASAVVTALTHDLGLCCDSVSLGWDGAPSLRCQTSRMAMWFVTLQWCTGLFCFLVFGLALFYYTYRFLSLCADPVSTSVATATADDEAMVMLNDRSMEEKSEALAQALLQLCSFDARRARANIVARLRTLLRFQEASCAVQERHMESLLLSHLSVASGNYDNAVRRLHAALLQPAARYAVKTSGAVKRVEKQGDHVSVWDDRSSEVLLEEIALFLLIWGESSNLRFMPEFIIFIFTIALGHVRGHEAVPATVSYFEGIVRPVYKIIFDETFQGIVNGRPKPHDAKDMPTHPMNYDDWNESFWTLAALTRLRTRAGTHVLAAASSNRWELLLQVDWQTFFFIEGKTFREMRWWYNLLASHRRVFLVQLLVMWISIALHFACRAPSPAGIYFMEVIMFPFPFSMMKLNMDADWWIFAMFPLYTLPSISAAIGALWSAWAVPASDASVLGLVRVKTRTAARIRIVHMLCSIVLNYVAVCASIATSIDGSEGSPILNYMNNYALAMLLLAAATANFGFLLMEELTVERPSAGAFDSNLSFEENACVGEHFKLGIFWLIIFALKVVVALTLTMPAIVEGGSVLAESLHRQEYTKDSLMRNCVDGQHPLSKECPLLDPAQVLRYCYIFGLLTIMILISLAETLFLYSVVLAFWGGARLLWMRPHRDATEQPGSHVGPSQDYQTFALLKGIIPNAQAWTSMCAAIFDDLYKSYLISAQEKEQLGGKLERMTPKLPKNKEARRRLNQFKRSLVSSSMPVSKGALFMPGLTVLVPHFGESILQSAPGEVSDTPKGKQSRQATTEQQSSFTEQQRKLFTKLSSKGVIGNGRSCGDSSAAEILQFGRNWLEQVKQRSVAGLKAVTRGTDDDDVSTGHGLDIWGFIIEYHPDEWVNLISRLQNRHLGQIGNEQETEKVIQLELRKWASVRLQTLHRTLAGMMQNRHAMQVLFRASLPQLNEAELNALVDTKFQLLAALQRYGVMKNDELDDVEVLLADYPTLNIAYIDEVDDAASGERRYYSCLIDGTCARDEATGRRVPLYRVELPGHPILGNGKGDNQNCAIIFSRGAIIQAIDCNQDHYLEEAFKLPNALAEFQRPHYSSFSGGPSIVGFNEHIFSTLGSLGNFAAGAELAFGLLVQQTMTADLHSRYHYGHPDLLNKLHMISQGGCSKATRTLNLSEDIYAGMDAVLRGFSVVHRDYFTVGKGRDMGFLSILSFASKISSGTAQMTTSRQSYRLGTRLSLGRLLGFYYAHAGYYIGQLHFFHVVYVLLAFTFVCCLSDTIGLLPGASVTSVKLLDEIFSYLFFLFVAVSMLAFFFSACVVFGPLSATTKAFKQILWGAPVFFAVQSRCIGHYVAQEFAIGGAAYLPTGRGLATQHVRFHDLYKAFAQPCLYPGLELLLFIVLSCVASPTNVFQCSMIVQIITIFTAASLLVGPTALFNPHALSLPEIIHDLRAWFGWLLDDDGWLAFHNELVAKRKGAHRHGYLLPSKQMLIAFLLIVIISNRATLPLPPWTSDNYALRLFEIFQIILPIFPLCASSVVVLVLNCISRGKATLGPPEFVFGALLVLTLLMCEVAFVIWRLGGLASAFTRPPADIIAICACRYFCWRVLMSACAYLCIVLQEAAIRSAPMRLLVLDPLRLMVGSLALISDAILGLLLQLPVLIFAVVPFLNLLHFLCLFQKLPAQLAHSEAKAVAGSSLHGPKVGSQAWRTEDVDEEHAQGGARSCNGQPSRNSR